MKQAPLRVLVLFGSSSDEPVVKPLMKVLEQLGFEAWLEYVSAHRSPARLDEVLAGVPHDLIVAGAGLAAHLPGVTASKVTAPVIGVPVDGAFAGLDALMSIVQMPPGIPVLTAPMPTPANSAKLWHELLGAWVRRREKASLAPRVKVALVGDKKIFMSDAMRKARAILDYAAAEWSIERKPADGVMNIIAAPEGASPRGLKMPKAAVAVFLPVFKSARLKQPVAAVTLLKNIAKAKPRGFWVGANNAVNAVCAALQANNGDGRYTALLTQVKKGEFRG